MKNIILSIFFILSLSACSIYHIDSRDSTTHYYPSKKSTDEIAYIEKIDQPHEIIGYVTVNTERRQTITDVLEKMKREAAILGAEALTNIQTDASGTWKNLPAQELIGNVVSSSSIMVSPNVGRSPAPTL